MKPPTQKKVIPPPRETPYSQGFRMPGEWERHEATWLGWPQNRSDWPGKFPPIPWVYGEMVRRIAPNEVARILVSSRTVQTEAERILQRVGVDLKRVEFFLIKTNRGWTRDSGPLFVHRSLPKPGSAIVRFRFNGWARYPDCKEDDQVPVRAAKQLRMPLFQAQVDGQDVVLEGGSIDVNGKGTLISTEECLLDLKVQARNPSLNRRQVESVFREFLGAKHVLWLGRGIDGDDTHGHVDDVCRFVGPRTAVLCQERNTKDPNYVPLAENRERLQDMRLEDGGKIEVVPIPMPGPLYFDGRRVPASYANFYIANGAVLVPTFNDPNDRVALGILAELTKDRPIIGIHSVDLVWGLGTIHCLTQQQPSLG